MVEDEDYNTRGLWREGRAAPRCQGRVFRSEVQRSRLCRLRRRGGDAFEGALGDVRGGDLRAAL